MPPRRMGSPGAAASSGDATSRASRAADGERRAVAALAQVSALVEQRRDALASARSHRAEDERQYQAAQAASRALGARLRAAARSAPVRHAGRMLWPADGPLTSPFGYRIHPIYGTVRFHAGIDIGAGYGAPVSAAEGGTVVYAGTAQGYGTLVVISHGSDLATAYAHMSALSVQQGDRVAAGQLVGRVGNEGNSTGPHLHFEVRLDGNPVDPLDYVTPP